MSRRFVAAVLLTARGDQRAVISAR